VKRMSKKVSKEARQENDLALEQELKERSELNLNHLIYRQIKIKENLTKIKKKQAKLIEEQKEVERELKEQKKFHDSLNARQKFIQYLTQTLTLNQMDKDILVLAILKQYGSLTRWEILTKIKEYNAFLSEYKTRYDTKYQNIHGQTYFPLYISRTNIFEHLLKVLEVGIIIRYSRGTNGKGRPMVLFRINDNIELPYLPTIPTFKK